MWGFFVHFVDHSGPACGEVQVWLGAEDEVDACSARVRLRVWAIKIGYKYTSSRPRDAHVHSQHSTTHCFTIRVTHVLRPVTVTVLRSETVRDRDRDRSLGGLYTLDYSEIE